MRWVSKIVPVVSYYLSLIVLTYLWNAAVIAFYPTRPAPLISLGDIGSLVMVFLMTVLFNALKGRSWVYLGSAFLIWLVFSIQWAVFEVPKASEGSTIAIGQAVLIAMLIAYGVAILLGTLLGGWLHARYRSKN